MKQVARELLSVARELTGRPREARSGVRIFSDRDGDVVYVQAYSDDVDMDEMEEKADAIAKDLARKLD